MQEFRMHWYDEWKRKNESYTELHLSKLCLRTTSCVIFIFKYYHAYSKTLFRFDTLKHVSFQYSPLLNTQISRCLSHFGGHRVRCSVQISSIFQNVQISIFRDPCPILKDTECDILWLIFQFSFEMFKFPSFQIRTPFQRTHSIINFLSQNIRISIPSRHFKGIFFFFGKI